LYNLLLKSYYYFLTKPHKLQKPQKLQKLIPRDKNKLIQHHHHNRNTCAQKYFNEGRWEVGKAAHFYKKQNKVVEQDGNAHVKNRPPKTHNAHNGAMFWFITSTRLIETQ